jgi:hypothetical protein
MNRRPILGLTVAILLAQTPAANSQTKPNDAVVAIQDFVFVDGEILESLKLHYLTVRRMRSPLWKITGL